MTNVGVLTIGAVPALHDRLRAPDDDVPATALATDRAASPPIGTWKPDLTEFRVVQPWYRTKAATATLAAAALAAAALAAIAVSSAVLVSRGADSRIGAWRDANAVFAHHLNGSDYFAREAFF